MSDAATAAPAADTSAPAAAPAAAPASIAGNALFGAPPAADPAATAPAAGEQPAALTPEQQAEKDAAEAAAKEAEAAAIKRPGKDATPEEWAAFYKAIGAPETSDAYEVTIPEGANEAEIPLIQEMFKKANILPEQAAVLLEFRNKMFAEQTAAAAAAEEQRIAALDNQNKAEAAELTNEWGAQATANMEMARRGVTQFIDGDQARQMKVIASMESVLGYKDTMKFFHGIGKAIGEHDAAGLGSQNGQKAGSRSAAEVLYGGTAAK